jgi:hypothetical protein
MHQNNQTSVYHPPEITAGCNPQKTDADIIIIHQILLSIFAHSYFYFGKFDCTSTITTTTTTNKIYNLPRT